MKIVHLGDGAGDIASSADFHESVVYSVRGNCDSYDRLLPNGEELPLFLTFYAGKYKVLATHGHAFGVKSSLDELCRFASGEGADIVLYGHTHLPSLEYIKSGTVRGVDRDLALFNPGALCNPLDGCFGNLSVTDGGFLLSHGKLSAIEAMKKK